MGILTGASCFGWVLLALGGPKRGNGGAHQLSVMIIEPPFWYCFRPEPRKGGDNRDFDAWPDVGLGKGESHFGW